MATSEVHSFRPLSFLPSIVDDDQIVGMHHALAHAGGCRQDALRIQTHRDIAVVGRHPPLLIHQPPDVDNIVPVFLLRLRHAG